MTQRIRGRHVLSLVLVVGGLLTAAALYARLPQRLPTHWNWAGQPDGFTEKPWGPFVFPLLSAALWLVLAMLPRISPRGFRVERFDRVYGVVLVGSTALLLSIQAISFAAALGEPVAAPRFMAVALGLFFALLGNYLGKTTPNFWFGVRTPWTIASPEVWSRTHRLAGKLFVAAGLVGAILGAAVGSLVPLVAAVLTVAVISVFYSYIAYRGENANEEQRTS
jgi:uncharacterized membrane protein